MVGHFSDATRTQSLSLILFTKKTNFATPYHHHLTIRPLLLSSLFYLVVDTLPPHSTSLSHLLWCPYSMSQSLTTATRGETLHRLDLTAPLSPSSPTSPPPALTSYFKCIPEHRYRILPAHFQCMHMQMTEFATAFSLSFAKSSCPIPSPASS